MNRYRNTIGQNTTNTEGTIVSFVGVKYPDIPYTSGDIYVYTTAGDRLDNLAKQFYGSSEYYWVISVANPDLGMGSLYVPEGTQIRIPGNLSNIILNFQLLNNQ
jgi:phage tail protein X